MAVRVEDLYKVDILNHYVTYIIYARYVSEDFVGAFTNDVIGASIHNNIILYIFETLFIITSSTKK